MEQQGRTPCMNAGTIWWSQIGTSLRFLTQITNVLQDCQSTVLQLPSVIPWRQDFYLSVDLRRTSFSSQRSLRRLSWKDGAIPGAFILKNLCSPEIHAEYYPGLSHAAYLASRDDILLNDYYIWITGVHNKTDMEKWIDFISEYIRCTQNPDQHAVFILEYDGVSVDWKNVKNISYSVEHYDCRVFSLEAAAALKNASLLNYQSEIALSICENNPELCFALLCTGDSLLKDPLNTALKVLSSRHSDQGSHFSSISETQLSSSIWKAAVVLIFPILEGYRMDFIRKYSTVLSEFLPISNSNDSKITDPEDLEIGNLYYIVKNSGKVFSSSEVESIRLCRKVRNLLAHNEHIDYDDARKIFDLTL